MMEAVVFVTSAFRHLAEVAEMLPDADPQEVRRLLAAALRELELAQVIIAAVAREAQEVRP